MKIIISCENDLCLVDCEKKEIKTFFTKRLGFKVLNVEDKKE